MHISRFNYLVDSPKHPGVTFLYNSFHGSRVAVEEGDCNLKSLFKKIEDAQDLSVEELETAQSLQEMGFLVDDKVDEKAWFSSWMKNNVIEQKEYFLATIVTTIACNLRCTYCFEQDQLGKGKMSRETAQETLDWLIGRIKKANSKYVSINFFGGEPLLNVDAIRIIGAGLNSFCKENNIHYSSGAITNGIFLTPKLVDEFIDYGFNWLRVTLDGDQEYHDKKRIYAGGKGTFEQIFSNLEKIAGKIRLEINGNFDDENFPGFPALIQKLSKANFKNDIASIGFKPILPPVSEKNAQEAQQIEAASCRCTFSEESKNRIFLLQDQINKVGLPALPKFDMGICNFYSRESATIGHEGEIYRCEGFIGIKSLIVGHIKEDNLNGLGEMMLHASRPFEEEKCSTCNFPPICGGGCRADAYANTGTFQKISCRQEFFKEQIARDLISEYEESLHDESVNNTEIVAA